MPQLAPWPLPSSGGVQKPGFYSIFIGDITTDAGGVYVPPAYADEVIPITLIQIQKPILLNITTVGGGYP